MRTVKRNAAGQITHLLHGNGFVEKELATNGKLVKAGDSITIIGRRWFDKVTGNTYFSAVGLVNGIEVVSIPFEYGYGNQYEDAIYNKLYAAGYCSDRENYANGSREAFWNYCSRKGIKKYVSHSDVSRKKDL